MSLTATIENIKERMDAILTPEEKMAFEALRDIFLPYELRIAGGAVRDIVRGHAPSDIDFATTMPIEQMAMMGAEGKLPQSWSIVLTGVDHGTVTFVSRLGSFEVTSLRKDVETDGRHAKVEFGASWGEDAARRDFTMNAMSLDIDGYLYDFFGGKEDIKRNIVRFVGSAEDRIKEDALRIMRFYRFQARMMSPHSVTDDVDAVRKSMHLLSKISVERVWQEIKKAAEHEETFNYFLIRIFHDGVFEQFCQNPIKEHKMTEVSRLGEFISEFPAGAIGIACGSSSDVTRFCDTFKVSGSERKQMEFFHSFSFPGIVFEEHEAEVLAVEGHDKDWIRAVATYMGAHKVAEHIEKFVVPTFPITGEDIMREFPTLKGKEIGDKLKIMKDNWKSSRFKMDKDALLAYV